MSVVFLASALRARAAGMVGSAPPETLVAVTPPASPGDSALALAWVERTALERNPTLQAARAAWREAQARAERAGALEDPMIEAMLAPASLRSGAVDPAWRVEVSQKLPIFGQRRLRRRADVEEGRASGYDFETARLDLLREARDAYYEYFRIARSLEATREVADLMRELSRVALAKYAAGTVGQQDPLEAEVEIAMLTHDTVVLQRDRRRVLARLRALLHLPQDTTLAAPPRELPPPETREPSASLAAGMRPPWPELAAAEARVSARRAQLALARRQRLPEWSLGGAYDRFWSERELRVSATLGLNLPLNLGRLGDAEREARAGLARAESERQAVLDQRERAIEEARAALGESVHDVEVMRDEVVPATERALRAVQAGYEAGRSDFVALINAARDLVRARAGLADALTRAHQAGAELKRGLAADTVPLEREDQR